MKSICVMLMKNPKMPIFDFIMLILQDILTELDQMNELDEHGEPEENIDILLDDLVINSVFIV